MYYKNSTKRLIASIALLSQLVYTVNPFVYAFFYYSMSQRALAQETQVTETSNEISSSSEPEETTSTASEEANSENSEEQANTQEEPVVNNSSEADDVISVEETETPETELISENPVQDELGDSNEEQVAETTFETEPNIEPTSESEPKVEGEILGEGASSVRTESESSDFIEAKEQVNGMECINSASEIVSSTEEMWNLDSSKDTAETKENVKAGVKYEFPLNNDVSVTFTCLPKNIDAVSTLKIERIHVSELDLPEGIYPADEYAYDITTDMENGTFEYEISLPKSKELSSKAAEILYTEQSVSEIKEKGLDSHEAEIISNKDVSVEESIVTVDELDHFTLFLLIDGTQIPDFSNDWTNYYDALGHLVSDYEDDKFSINDDSNGGTNVSPEEIDIASAAEVSGANAGLQSSLQYFYEDNNTVQCSDDYLYLRMRLEGNPASSGNSGALYSSYHWDFLIDSNGDGQSNYVVDIFGGKTNNFNNTAGGQSGSIGLYPNNANATTYNTAGVLWTARADDDSNLYTQLEKEDYGDNISGNDQYWIEGAVPLNVNAGFLAAMCNQTNLNGKLFASTSTSNTDPLQKDWMNPVGFFTSYVPHKSVANLTNPGATTQQNPAKAGDIIEYTLTVTNDGNRSIPGFVISDDISDILDYAALLNGDSDNNSKSGTLSSGTLSWPQQNINVGQTITEKFTVQVKPANQWATDDLIMTNVYGDSVNVYILGVGYVTVNKVVIAHGANKVAGDFAPYKIGDTTVTLGQSTAFTPGTYSVTEVTDPNYTATYSASCANGQVTVTVGSNTICTITNERIIVNPTITLIKNVINDNGGNADADDFTLYVGNSAITSGQTVTVTPNTSVSIDEIGLAGYDFVSITGANCPTTLGGTVSLDEGQNITCTITNDDIQPKLTITKVVVNDNGGTKQISDFPLFVNQTSVTSGVQNGFNAGVYTVSETNQSGYTATISGDCDANGSITLGIGDVKSCTITNNDQAGTLIVKKVVVNDNGGLLEVDDFGFQVNNGSTVAFEADGQNDLTVNAGSYNIVEPAVAGYATTYDNCANVFVSNGGTTTCTITNNDIQPKLKVTKVVINDNNGNKQVSDFPLFVGNTSVTSGVENGFNVGTYTVSETQQTGYSATFSGACDANGSVTLSLGDVKECVITNNDVQPKLTVTKVVTNDNGGVSVVSDFNLYVGNTQVTSGVQNGFNAGSYVVSEDNVSGYTGTISGDCDANGNITLNPGDVKSCIITNDDQIATLIVTKVLVNDNGGSKDYDDFSFTINNVSPIAFEADGSNSIAVNAGTYSIVETAVTGYTITYDNCTNVSIPNGGTATCTITNDDQPATLIVKKVLIQDNGGTKSVNEFSFEVNNDSAISFEADGQNDLTVDAGTYSVVETAVSGYTTSYDNCSNVLIPNGGIATCTITNNDQAGTLIVTKVVTNDNGGTKTEADFGFSINGGNTVAFEADGTNNVNVSAGTYTVIEPAVYGYATTYDNCFEVVVSNGETETCTVTNNDIAPLLTVTKVVINDNNGVKQVSDFPLFVNQTQVTSGVQNSFTAGNYTVSETSQTGYAATISGDCSTNGSISLAVGDVKSCTITNDDIQPKLTVTKVVTNNNGGTKVIADFPLFVGNTSVTSGVENGFNVGSYVVSETNVSGYTATITGDCDENGNITLNPGDDKSCTITNDDQAATLIVKKVLVKDNGGTKEIEDFSFSVNDGNVIAFEADGQNDLTVNAGTYSVVETTASGYTTTYDNCSEVSIPNGGTATCTITNDDQPATLIVKKVVINDDGGLLKVENFSFSVNNESTLAFETDGQNDLTVDAGTYSVVETVAAGYATTYDNCSRVSIPNGGTATCTITNNDIAGTLIVQKVLDNKKLDSKTYTDFEFKVNDGNAVSFEADGQNDLTVAAGTYTIVETAAPGYTTTYDNCTDVVVALNSTETCVITNTIQPAKITIEKQTLPDGHQETFEFTGDLSGFISDGQTLSSGDLAAGTYTVTEVAEEGWDLTGVSCTDDDSTYDLDKGQITFNVDWNEEVKCTVTNTQRGSISGTKYEYLGDEVEPNTLGDWTINLYGSDWGLLTSTTTSNVDGSYQFANLVPGDYYICENNPEGWKQLTPSTGSTRPETTQICHSVSVEAGETVVEQDFENAKLSDVHGYKWEDLDQDGYRDICEFREGRIAQLDEECVPEPLLSGWRIFIDENKDGIYQPGNDETPGEPSMLTDDSEEHFGWYWFEDLMPGEYQICEVLESEWIQTYPYQSTEAYCHTVNLPDDTSEQTLNAVLAPEYNFGNYHELPTLLISKFNNKEGVDLRIGDEITYTIQVTVEEATAGNVKVTDLLPQGVEYKGSSWTATSTVRGDISGLGEPTYNSPGVWTLGDMIPEEIVTLTYTGIVENGTDDGIYKDLAWAKATEQNILALAEEDGNKIATNFVGTEIEVVSDPVEEDLEVDIGEDEKIEEVGEVLGASTSLPATGSATALLIALLFGLIGGLGMFIYSRNISKNKKLILGLVMLMATLLSVQPAYAAEGDNLYVRLEEPNVSQTTNFDLSFVALDSNNDPIEIICWKKGPSDGAFVTFGSPTVLNNGGDTGVCSVTGSVLTSDGDYKFKVSAETQTANPLDSVTKESEEVSVSYDGTKPGKPFDIEKERDNSCQFELSFKTADDGQTAYVEIYRDDEREFTASPSKLHKTIVIGPDSSYTFEDDLYGSECGKTFYYGIRAFDSLGNGSELGEEEDTEKTTKVTKTITETKEETGAILSSGGSVSSDAGDNSSEVVLPGDILGESNTASDDESNDGSFGTAFDGILDSLKNPKMLLIILAALLLLGYGIYRARKNR